MSDQIILGTRKGTLILDRKGGGWTPRPIAHAGMSISYAARDPRDRTLWVAMASCGSDLGRTRGSQRAGYHHRCEDLTARKEPMRIVRDP